MSRSSNTTVVRTGPVSILALLMVLVLATLAVLSLATARANDATATRQLEHVQQIYLNEVEAQGFLAHLDQLVGERRSSSGAVPSAAELAQACQAQLVDESTLEARFTHQGRQLTVQVRLDADGGWHVIQYRTESATGAGEQEQPRLWGGLGSA